MLTLESLAPGQSIVGIEPTQVVPIAFIEPMGPDAVIAYYTTADGAGGVKERLLTRADEPSLSITTAKRPWLFDGDGANFDVAVEAERIIAGLYGRELLKRADARRVLVVAPGSLVEQWREEPYESSGFQGSKVSETKRFQLANKLGRHTVHLLLVTATLHKGKEEDFDLFLSILDSDRFYGQANVPVHVVLCANHTRAHKDARPIADQFTQVALDELRSPFSSAAMTWDRLRSAAIELTDEAASEEAWRTFSERDAIPARVLSRLQARDLRALP